MRWRWRPYGSAIHVDVMTAQVTALDQEPHPARLHGVGCLVIPAEEWHDVVALLGPRVEVVCDEDED